MEQNPVFHGNETACRFLRQAGENKLSGHAYLVYGEDGLGKKTFAELFAKAILCRDFPKPCFRCSSCRKIAERIHPDVKWYLGGEGKNSFHIEQIREIRKDCAVKPNESEKKIYILTNVQNMTQGAVNAFLKTLEEPPAHAVFILTAPNMDALLPTVVSRVIPIELFPLPDDVMMEALGKKFPEAEETLLKAAVRSARGNLGKAEKMLSSEEFAAGQSEAEAFCEAVLKKKEYDLLKILSAYEKDKNRLLLLLERFEQILRTVMFYKQGTALPELSEQGRRMGESFTRVQIRDLVLFTEEVMQKAKTNANGSLLCAYLCMGIAEIIS